MDKCISFGLKWNTFNVAFNDQIKGKCIKVSYKDDIYQHYCMHYYYVLHICTKSGNKTAHNLLVDQLYEYLVVYFIM